MAYWLFKTEPQSFSIDDLIIRPQQKEPWDGIRNYQARNILRDQVKADDRVFIYHSSCPKPGIAGIAKVSREAYPDPTQFDPGSQYYDPKSTVDKPRWLMVDVEFQERFSDVLSLKQIKANPHLDEMGLVKKGNRLSIQPVTGEQWQALLHMAQRQD